MPAVLDPSNLLAELVTIPSVNPMGRGVAPDELYERRLTEHLEQWFRSLGLETFRQTIEPNRDNIVARLDGDSAATPVVLFDAHQDTVPVEGMTIDPFKPVVRNGRLSGRGACDIKGGMAAMLAAVARLANERPRQRPTVLMSCTVNEEHGFTGAQGLCELWSHADASLRDAQTSLRHGESSIGETRPHGLKETRPHFVIVAEPTELDVIVAHKGMVRWQCRTKGRAAHSSVPEKGTNAIFRMTPVLAALEGYQSELAAKAAAHPLCGKPTLSVGTIRGGISVNTVPDSCTIEIDRRLLPNDDPASIYREVIDYLARQIDDAESIEHLPPIMQSRGLSEANNAALADRLAAAVGEVQGTAKKSGVPFGTNATAFGRHFPTVVFGPGSIAQAHTADEWVELEQVERASEILYRFLRNVE
jgi:acetylornithine deacetylase/succinyl-diaminopimelate desuccinylase-like protein